MTRAWEQPCVGSLAIPPTRLMAPDVRPFIAGCRWSARHDSRGRRREPWRHCAIYVTARWRRDHRPRRWCDRASAPARRPRGRGGRQYVVATHAVRCIPRRGSTWNVWRRECRPQCMLAAISREFRRRRRGFRARARGPLRRSCSSRSYSFSSAHSCCTSFAHSTARRSGWSRGRRGSCSYTSSFACFGCFRARTQDGPSIGGFEEVMRHHRRGVQSSSLAGTAPAGPRDQRA